MRSIYSSILQNPECITIILRFQLLIIINVSWAANQNIRMISERSFDTEDSSNSYCKFRFYITGIKWHLKMYLITTKLQLKNHDVHIWVIQYIKEQVKLDLALAEEHPVFVCTCAHAHTHTHTHDFWNKGATHPYILLQLSEALRLMLYEH